MSIKRKLALLSLIFISVLAVAFGLTACGGNKNNDDDDDSTYTYDGTSSYLYYTITVVFDGEVAGKERVYFETGNTLNYSSYTSKTGYEFLGYYASDGVMMFDADGNQLEYGIDKDYTLYGKFSAKTYTFKYMIESDGEYVEYTTQSVVYDTTLTDLVSAPEVTGYTFKGWARSSLGSKFYSNGTNPINNTFNTSNYSINSSGVVYLYAVYSVKTFTVTLNYNDYTLTNKTITVNYGDTLPDLSDYCLTVETEGTKKGKEVTGWSAYQNSTIEYTSQVYMDMTVYAIWTEYRYVNLYCAEDDIRQQKYYYSTSSCVLPTDTTIPGYTLDGWYETASYSGNPVTKAAYSQLKDTYYAKWNLATYTITFVYDGASYEDIQYTINSDTITLPVIEKYGYNFYGWCTSSDLIGTAITQIVPSASEGGYGDFTLYAKIIRYESTVDKYFDNSKIGSLIICYGDSFNIPVPKSYLGSSREFNYWYMVDDNGDTIILTDSNGDGLFIWEYMGESYKVYCSYEQLYSITLTYAAPNDGTSFTINYGYYHVGDVVTIMGMGYENYGVSGYYINNTLVSSEEEFEYTVTASDVVIEVEYSFKVASEFTDEYNFPYTVYYYNGHYYAIVKSSKSWSEAEQWCEFYGGHLVTITTSSEQKWIASLLSTYDSGNYAYNIGGYYSGSAWHWVTGETFSYTNWHSGEPSSSSENYIGFYYKYTDYTWADNSGDAGYFIIEWESAEDCITIIEKTVTDSNGDSVTLTLYKYNSHYYAVVETSMIWDTAEYYAEYIGGHLVTITSSSENTFVGSLITYASAGAYVYYMGGTDNVTEGTWEWVTGEKWSSYTNWSSNQPDGGSNQNHTAMYSSNYTWDDETNTTARPFIIEWESLDDVGVFTPLYAIKNITTASDFMSIQYNTAGYYILKSDITLTSSWTPVDFSGTFIGNGYTVSGITVNQSSGNAGVFLNVTGYIENVTFEVTVNSTSTSTVYVGGAVAYLNGGTLKDITVKGTVTSVSGSAYTGGVVGYYSTGTVSGLTNYATVNGSATGTGTTGGVIGRADIFGVTNLVNHGTVTGYYDVGGVIGYLHIYNSNPSETASGLVNYGDVSGDSSSGSCGGVIGVIYRSLSNTTNYSFTLDGAKNYGNVTSTSGNVGGVVGYVYLANGGNGAFVFIGEDLYNEGDVTSSKGNVGGLVGYGYAKSTTSYIYGTSKANVSGTYYVGGIAGYLNNISLKQSSNAGSNVSASGNTNDGTGDCVGVGGYVGYGYNITISDCDNAVDITYTGGTFKYVGGVAGYVRGTITNCTNTAAVTSSGYEVGGVVGTFAVPGSVTVSNLTNGGAVEGTSYKVGGVFGNIWWDGSVSSNIVLTLSGITNSGNVTSSSYGAGGIAGYIYFNNSNGSYTISIQATSLINTGDVTGAYYVGGLVGYGYTESNASYITTSSSEADVTGGYYVGGLAGYLSNISLTNSSNEDSTVTATSYTSDTVYLGGYVGYGYIVSGLENAVNITYSYSAKYIGGVAGYLTGTISDCSNSGTITAASASQVGGVAGMVVYGVSGTTTMSKLSNTGAVTGSTDVGGIIGWLSYNASISGNISLILSDLTNSGTIIADGTNVSGGAGGIIGWVKLNNSHGSYTYIIDATELVNTGNVTSASYYAGGIFGYGYAESNSSYITNSSSSAAVTGTYYVGGIAGYLENISVTDCSNTGSTVTATSYTSDTVYLGGYVGYGYIVSGCDNAVNIDYTASDSVYYVGGIAGYLTGAVTDCSNSGDISGARSVGGIVGNGAYSSSLTLSNLTNTGNITGTYHVGGIFGEIYCNQSVGSAITLTLTSLTNCGTVKGSSYAVGGITGYVYLNNTNGSYTYILHATGLENTGSVTGSYEVGGLIGYGYTESNSSYITSSSCGGAVSGEYYVGGLAGYLSNIILKDSTNEGATVSSTSYMTSNGVSSVYLGGCVGYGYSLSGLTNAVSITYNQSAWYVGGVAGYLTGTAESCTNNGTITASKASAVGGVIGGITGITSGTSSKLTNSGDVTGGTYTGGVIGYVYTSIGSYTNYTVYFTTLTNGGSVTGGSYTGGDIGYLYFNNSNYSIAVYLTALQNTGDVSGKDHTGGVIGYGYTDNSDSYLTSSSSSGAVSGEYYVGGLAGYLSNISLTDSTNEGAAVSATSYMTSNGVSSVYLGGYVGYGYSLSGLTNTVSITYNQSAWYVGGVAGCLTGTAESCTNSGTITASKASAVGGVIGGITGITSGTNSKLTNSGDVTGGTYTGGVIGYVYTSIGSYTNYTVYFSTLTNSGSVTGGSYTGGDIGYLYFNNSNYSIAVYLTALQNTGDVSGKDHTGGVIGYGYTDNSDSYIVDSSNAASVIGTYYLGGIAGYLSYITIKDSYNDGTTLSSSDYLTGSTVCAYVGGYVGYGYSVSGLTNAVSITYDYSAWYVGGVAGCLTGIAESCTNSGTITASKASAVGGIAGGITGITSGTCSTLTNSGDITGSKYVGGIIGYMYTSIGSYTNYTVYLSKLTNSGSVTASGEYAGGNVGYLYFNNSNYSIAVTAVDMVNTGAITASDYCYGIFGYGYTDGSSTVTGYTSTDTISCSGDNSGTTYSGSNITFSN